MQEELPVGWVECNLGDVVYLRNGFAFKSSTYLKSGTPVLRISDIQVGTVTSENAVRVEFSEEFLPYQVNDGDILIAMSGATTGKFGVYRSKDIAFQNQRVGNFIPHSDSSVHKIFVYYLLSRLQRRIEKDAYGGAQPNISSKKIEAIEILLPPLNEQKRIVAKIEELFSEVDQGIANLQRAQTQLKTYRQSVLKHAFEGKLTAQWRTENQGNLEPAEALLERIQQERESFYQQQLQNWQQQCDEAKTNGTKKPKKPKDISLIKIEGDKLNIPNAWLQTNIETFLSLTRKGLKTGPFGMALKKSEHQHSGFPVLGIENIGFCKFIDGNKIFITDKKAKELSSFEVYPKDVIVSRSGTVGEICVVPDRVKEARISSNLMRICLNSEVVDSNYFVYQFQGAVSILNEIKELCKGSSREFLNQSILNSLNFTLPPFSEQNQIVQEIESRLSVCDKMEQTIEESLKKAEALKQSILKKAFSGKLVPQDPNDEPASVLLERIKDEKESLAKESKKAGRKKK